MNVLLKMIMEKQTLPSGSMSQVNSIFYFMSFIKLNLTKRLFVFKLKPNLNRPIFFFLFSSFSFKNVDDQGTKKS